MLAVRAFCKTDFKTLKMTRRTKIDFSKHELKVTKLEGVLIHEFKRPDTRNCMLVFINTNGIMSVTGDFGNWIFCREFHPSADNEHGVSGGYWDEKLEISSVQKSDKYDAEQTTKLLNEFKETFEDSFGREMDEDEKEWIEQLENNVDDEHEYTYLAYREKPSTIDYESVPFGEKRHFWLDCVYDGFDAICQTLHSQSVALA
jgi:hypothetical protein